MRVLHAPSFIFSHDDDDDDSDDDDGGGGDDDEGDDDDGDDDVCDYRARLPYARATQSDLPRDKAVERASRLVEITQSLR